MILIRPKTDKKMIILAVSLALVFSALPGVMPVPSNGATPQEYQVKAIYISNMAKFTHWPADTLAGSGDEFRLYIMGEYRFGSSFAPLVGQIVHDRPLSVLKLENWEDIPSDCRILFLGISDKEEMNRVLEKVEGKPILTISDEDGFTTAGGMIELFTSGKKIRFRINQTAAENTGLKISSKLLKLAVPEEEKAR
jgi:hypothetical protein